MKYKNGMSIKKKASMTGFFHRKATKAGRKILNRRRSMGRAQICGRYT